MGRSAKEPLPTKNFQHESSEAIRKGAGYRKMDLGFSIPFARRTSLDINEWEACLFGDVPCVDTPMGKLSNEPKKWSFWDICHTQNTVKQRILLEIMAVSQSTLLRFIREVHG